MVPEFVFPFGIMYSVLVVGAPCKQTKGKFKQACATAKYFQAANEQSEAANAGMEDHLKQKVLEIAHLKNLFIQNALRNLQEAKCLLTSNTADDVLVDNWRLHACFIGLYLYRNNFFL